MTRKSTKSADQTSRKECDHVRNGTVVVQKSLGFLSVSNFEYGQPASFIQASKQRLVACANRLLVYHGATIQSPQTTGNPLQRRRGAPIHKVLGVALAPAGVDRNFCRQWSLQK
jgi:hypothetical protein